jgi:hypothetical protein
MTKKTLTSFSASEYEATVRKTLRNIRKSEELDEQERKAHANKKDGEDDGGNRDNLLGSALAMVDMANATKSETQAGSPLLGKDEENENK